MRHAGRYIYLFVILFLCLAAAAKPCISQSHIPIQFRSLTINEGLSQSTVTDITQDEKGFIWIATQDGLNRFDGYTFKVFRHHNLNPNSLPHNWIKTLEIDEQGLLWIATQDGGLAYMHLPTETIYRIPEIADHNHTHGSINDILLDKDSDKMWLATDNGLCFINIPKSIPSNSSSADQKQITFSASRSVLLPNYRITSLLKNGDALLAGSIGYGFHLIDSDNKVASSYLQAPGIEKAISVNDLIFDQEQHLWVGTDDQGVLLYDSNFQFLQQYSTDTSSLPSTVNNNTIEILFEDSLGSIWIGTQGGGLNQYNPDTQSFKYYKHDENSVGTLSHDTVFSIFEDRYHNLWVGTYLGGISLYNHTQKPFYNISQESGLSYNVVRALFLQDDNKLWIGTRGGGLNLYNLDTHQFEPTIDQIDPQAGLPDPKVNTIIKARDQLLWIGTWGGRFAFISTGNRCC